MAKRSKKQSTSDSAKRGEEQAKQGRATIGEMMAASETSFLFNKRSWLGDGIAVLALYIVTLVLFWSFVTDNNRFSISGDAYAARAWNDVGAEIDAQVDGPAAWNPYVFLGFPTYGSLAYHPDSWLNPANWLDVPGRYLFGTSKMNLQVFYYFLSGLLMFLFARGVGLPWWAALLAGLAWLLNPYNVSLAEAGHGSKHWTITMMPLVLLLTHRVLDKRRLFDLALLALGTAALLLSMHAQIAYYGLLVGGAYALIWFIGQIIRDRGKALRGIAGYAGGSILGLAMSAFLYWPVYVFSKYSIRGTGPLRDAGGASGLDWDYATAWSLHPLESLQFLVPGWFGLGGSAPPDNRLGLDTALDYNLYWGWMPFTQSSLYMGIIPLLLAILAAVWLWRKNGVVRWMGLAAVIAWVVSFGKFLPVLYAPLYYSLPFFDKFRVPSMALTVTALGVALLAGFGISELVRRLIQSRVDDDVRKSLSRLFTIILVVAIVAFAYAAFVPGPMDTFLKEGETRQYDSATLDMLLGLRWEIFTRTMLATAVTLAIFSLAVRLALRPKLAFLLPTMIAVGVVFTGYDLMTLDARFLHPVPERQLDARLTPNSAIKYLQQQRDQASEPFRVYPVSRFQDNTLMYHRVQSIGGYGANKLRVYQDLLDYAFFDERGQPNLNLSGMMNARYLTASQQLPESFPLVHADEQSRWFVHLNPFALPRAWFVDEVEVAADPDDMMSRIAEPTFDPSTTAVVLEQPEMMPVAGDTMRSALVPNDSFGPQSYTIQTSNSEPGFLVLSEIWYPQGWYVTVDGEPAQFMQTNYAIRGLPLPAGEHTIEVWYDPPEIAAGFTVSRIALGITLLLLVYSAFLWVKERRVPARSQRAPESEENGG